MSDHFDLLPFIAILMCLLGALLLITISMTAFNLGPGAGEGWIPMKDTLKITKTPILIEWDGVTAVIHKQNKKIYAEWSNSTLLPVFQGDTYVYKSDSTKLDPMLWNIISELERERENKYALFAVRPSGFKNFYKFAGEFRNRNIDVGKEPMEQGKKVRLIRR